MEHITSISLLLILIIVSIWDIRTKRIPNAFIFLGLIMGVGNSYYINGFEGITTSLFAIVLSFIVFIWFWGFIAAGDVKLMFVIASFLGVGLAFKILMFSFLIAALLLAVINHKETYKSINKIKYFLFYKVPIQAISKTKARAYSPFILLSYILVMYV